MLVTLLDSSKEPDGLIEYAGRVCYNSVKDMHKNPGYVQARVREGHESILEHAYAVFEVEGVSRSCLQQVARHGLMSLSVESQRYVNQEGKSHVVPQSVIDKGCLDLFASHIAAGQEVYNALIAGGVPKEDARYVLSECQHTRFILSGNFRMYRNFIAQRSYKAAQWEIRGLSNKILGLLHKLAPQSFADLWERFGN